MVTMLDTFASVIKSLEDHNFDYMIVGSLASMTYGEPRLTKDMDVVIEISPGSSNDIIKLFPGSEFYTPPKEVLGQEIINRGQFNVVHHESGLKVDFIIKKLSPHAQTEFSRRVRVELTPEIETWMATPEDVIIKKLVYFQEGQSPKHLSDIKGILASSKLDFEYILHWVEELKLQGEWEIAQK